MPYDLIYMGNVKNRTNEQKNRKQTDKYREVVARRKKSVSVDQNR